MTELVRRRLREEAEVLFQHLWTEDADVNLILCHSRELLSLAEEAVRECSGNVAQNDTGSAHEYESPELGYVLN